MDSHDLTPRQAPADAAMRLACIESMCVTLATELDLARTELHQCAETRAHFIAASLGKLGWIADQAQALAGGTGQFVIGDAAEWLCWTRPRPHTS